MKKFMLFLAVVAVLLSLTVVSLATEAKPGEEVTITLSLHNTNAAYVRVVADYDKNVFELVGYSAVSGQAGANGIVVFDIVPLPSGAVGTVTLRVKGNAAPGTYTVSALISECYDINENSGTASASGGSVTVVGKATPAPTVPPTAKPTATPTVPPTAKPTATSTVPPTAKPTATPTAGPTAKPTATPTAGPTAKPTATPTAGPTAKPTAKPTDKPSGTEWRYHQNVSSLGIRFRDVKPGVTNEWLMFTPLDLSQDGVQEIDLIAANISYVGKVTVRVSHGNVKVEEHVKWPAEKLSMQFTLLPDLASVTSADISAMKTYAFGQEISIADELGGDTKVLLFVSGYVNYDFKDSRNELFLSNSASYQQLVKQLRDLMD